MILLNNMEISIRKRKNMWVNLTNIWYSSHSILTYHAKLEILEVAMRYVYPINPFLPIDLCHPVVTKKGGWNGRNAAGCWYGRLLLTCPPCLLAASCRPKSQHVPSLPLVLIFDGDEDFNEFVVLLHHLSNMSWKCIMEGNDQGMLDKWCYKTTNS